MRKKRAVAYMVRQPDTAGHHVSISTETTIKEKHFKQNYSLEALSHKNDIFKIINICYAY